MIVIFEGPDRVGKDTQIRLLKEYYFRKQFQTLHYSAVKGADKEYYVFLFEDMFDIFYYMNKLSIDVICNRSHIGEYVYAPKYRKYDASYIFDLEDKCSDKDFFRKTILITLLDTPEKLIKRDDGDSFSIKLKDKKEEITLFEEAYQLSKIKHKLLIYNDNKTPEEINKIIVEAIKVSGV